MQLLKRMAIKGGAVSVKEYTDKINYATTNSWTMTTMRMQAGQICEVRTENDGCFIVALA